mgnify:CR=1 FL=1
MYQVKAYFRNHIVTEYFIDKYDAIEFKETVDAHYPLKVIFNEGVYPVRTFIVNSWNAVMDDKRNPLSNIPDMNTSFTFSDYDVTSGDPITADATLLGDSEGNISPPNQIAICDMTLEIVGDQLIMTRSDVHGADFNEIYYVEFLRYSDQPYTSSFYLTQNAYQGPDELGFDPGGSDDGVSVDGFVDFIIPPGSKRGYLEIRANGLWSPWDLSAYEGPAPTNTNRTNGNQMYAFTEVNFDLEETTGYFVTITTSTQQQLYAWQEIPIDPDIDITDLDIYGQLPNSDERLNFEIIEPNIFRVHLENDKIAYVSFENNRPQIFIQTLSTGERIKLLDGNKSSSAPAWSPNEKFMAYTSSVNGNLEIFIYNFSKKSISRFTNSIGIDTEAEWGPKSKKIYFTSDRSGKPHIYSKPVRRGNAKRLTFDGSYNADANVSSDGKFLSIVHNGGNGHKIAIYSLDDKYLKVISKGRLDEAPSFAPNNKMVLFASKKLHKGILVATSNDGRIRKEIELVGEDVREPIWSH